MNLKINHLYHLQNLLATPEPEVFRYLGDDWETTCHKFLHLDTGHVYFVDFDSDDPEYIIPTVIDDIPSGYTHVVTLTYNQE